MNAPHLAVQPVGLAAPSPLPSAAASPAAAAAASTAPASFEILPLPGPLGAEVLGLDLSQPLSAADFARLHQAHLQYHLLVFRQQAISPAQQVDFSRRFGPLQIHVLRKFQLPGHEEIMQISNIVRGGEPIGLGDAGHFWHSDLSYVGKPSLGSMLHAQILPETGGDTLFANQHLAWEELPATLKAAVVGRWAEHSYLCQYEELRRRNPWRPALTQAQIDEVRPVRHPIVVRHPETGRAGLFVSEHFTTRIVGLPEDESRALLAELFAHSTKADFSYRHVWQPQDMLFWDNRSLQHLAAGTPDDCPRLLYRTTIEGSTPLPAF